MRTKCWALGNVASLFLLAGCVNGLLESDPPPVPANGGASGKTSSTAGYGATTSASGGTTTSASGGTTTSASGGTTTSASGGTTTSASGGATTSASGGATTSASGGTTTSASGGATTSASGGTTSSASGGTTSSGGSVASGAVAGTGGLPTTSLPAGGGSGLRVFYAAMEPGGVMLGNSMGLLLALNGSGELAAVGPRLAHDLSMPDPGPRITKRAVDGRVLDVKEYPDAITPELMAVDSKGAVILGGQLYRAMNFGGASIGPVEDGYYLVKLDSQGKQQWARAISTPDGFWLKSLAVDKTDNIYLGGEQSDMSSGWLGHAHISKFGADGSPLWERQFQNTNSTGDVNGIALFSDGSVALAGAFNGTMQVGTHSIKTLAISQGYESYNGWLAHLDASNGEPSMVERFGGAIFDYAQKVGVTSSDRWRVAGVLSGQSSVAGLSLSSHAEGSPFVAELDKEGQGKWIRKLGPRGAVFDAATGAFERTVAVGRFDPENAGDSVPDSLVDSPAFAAVVENDGTLTQVLTFRTDSNGAHSVVMDAQGGVWVSGEFTGAVAFGGYTLQASDYQTFLIKLSPTPLD